jgi:hypothetical protein
MKTPGLLLILICTVCPHIPAQQTLEGSVASNIGALEHAWLLAQSRHDNRALDLIFDNALVYIEYGKTVTKGEYLSRVRATAPKPPQIVAETMTIRTFEDAAIVVGTYIETNSSDGKASQRRWRFVDTWVKKHGRWVLVAAAAARVTR